MRLTSLIAATVALASVTVSWSDRGEAAGAVLSDVALLQRCYLQLTQAQLAAGDPLITRVKAGENPIDVCIGDVFRAALLTQDGDSYLIPTAKQTVGKQVLDNFHRLHSSWFYFRKPHNPVVLGTINARMPSVYEVNGAANYYTRALFDQSINADYFLTTADYLRTVRDGGQVTDSIYLSPTEDAIFNDYLGSGVNVMYDRGVAVGVKILPANQRIFATTTQDNYPRAIVTYPSTSLTLFQNFGGGILGMDYYLGRTYDETIQILPDGVTEVPRKWSESIFRDLMCLDLPVVRESDAAPFVQPTADASFRRSVGCTACHVTIDRMAGVVKSLNYGERRTQGVWTTYVDTTRWNKGDAGDYSWSSNYRTTFSSGGKSYSNYIKEDHVGFLYYRDYTGDLVDVKIDSIAKLGTALSHQRQPYLCAAKRYYKYFTGIDVDIADPGVDPKPLSPSDQRHFDFVDGLADLLITEGAGGSHQFGKMSSVVEAILRSPQYKTSDFGASDE